jgi:mRNA interferase HigB
VRIISRKRLAEFWRSRKHDAADAERALSIWHKLAKAADWDHFAALKQTFGSADQVGNCVVFDVGNNKYRLIGRIFYGTRIVYVLKVMDHKEYDRNRWPDDCGCHKPPPEKKVAAPHRDPKNRRGRRK